ncbi:MAG: TrpB-like pyridoxal phosphate-dependent enzyme [Candidatus Altiarchaeales archaeon]|nr:TrpB-like pyridoxal phosphate-dependent enzyme [Candidatus Altiarchaeales archaeon]MBD3415943.1 TrpB-like pyridoxal phosphate-dependent enzyme [Candidatus Altiarchaeales archaeon]
MDDVKFVLDENELPKKWYNVNADLPKPLDPPLHPMTLEPLGPEDLAPLFPMECIKQEMSPERYIDIPGEVRDVLRLWRPSPLYRARRLEKLLKTPAKIYYKWEGVSPPGSHKPNTAVAQAYYNMKEGIERISTETGAGQWGSSLAFATKLFELECMVYMVKCSYEQKPYRRIMMEAWGAKVVPSPSELTDAGKAILKKDSKCPGSLGIAISEAVNDAMAKENTHYSLGSVLNHVCIHQSVVGLEAKKQLEMAGEEKADIVVGCVGGGSNFAGLAFPYVHDKVNGADIDIVAVEPMACPTLTKGTYAYDYGDTAKMAPIVKMYTLGHDFVPEPIHAGGLRYHGDSPQLSLLVSEGVIRAEAYHQIECFDAAKMFAETEGFLVAPETSHAVKGAIEAALKCKESGEERVIVFNNSGHGHFDLAAYDAYHQGKLVDYEYPAELIKQSLKNLPDVGGN